jgi:hypothetical protein
MTAPVFTASEGKVFRHGVYVPDPSRQLGVFLESAEAGDWFAPRAAELATELQDAISLAEAYHEQKEAA